MNEQPIKQKIYKRWWFWVILIVVLGGLFALFMSMTGAQFKDIDPSNPPKFIQADFINLSKIMSISKFRSNQGHDFSDSYESCRSMKHYFGAQPPEEIQKQMDKDGKLAMFQTQPDPATATDIYSPVNGRIVSISGEKTPVGKQIRITPDGYPGFTIRLFHVYPDDNIKLMSKVTAGQHIGLIHQYQSTDISVQYQHLNKVRMLSYFAVMQDNVFANYIARGAKSRDDFIVPKDYRDTHPLQCAYDNQESFTAGQPGLSEEASINEFHLSGYKEHGLNSNKPTITDPSQVINYQTCNQAYPSDVTYPEKCTTPEGKVYYNDGNN